MDRFSIGLPDAQEQAVQTYACRYCGEEMISGDEVWELVDEYFCQAECAVRYVGGDKQLAK